MVKVEGSKVSLSLVEKIDAQSEGRGCVWSL